jgi:hypothetical protein
LILVFHLINLINLLFLYNYYFLIYWLRLFKYLEAIFTLNFIFNSIIFMKNMKVIQIIKNLMIIFIDYFFLRIICSNQINSNRRNHLLKMNNLICITF